MIHRNVPTVMLLTERFVALAKAVASGKGMPDFPWVVMPMNPQFYVGDEIQRETLALVDGIAKLLAPGVTPLQAKEAA
jgi:hypothetical protein